MLNHFHLAALSKPSGAPAGTHQEPIAECPPGDRLRGWYAALMLFLGVVGVLPTLLLTPPFEVPDEAQHFFRAYQISELHLRGNLYLGKAGGELPSSLIELTERFLGTRALHADRVVRIRPLPEIVEVADMPLAGHVREFINFSGSASYFPLAYLPQATAIAVARAVGATPLEMFYIARAANGLAAIFILACAIYLLPAGRGVALATALLPMALYLYASLSPDALIIACAYLFAAVTARGLISSRLTSTEMLAGVASAATFCSIKIVYAPLLFISLPAIFALNDRRSRESFIAYNVALLAVVLLSLAWMTSVSGLVSSIKPGQSSMSGQLDFIIENPLSYAQVILCSIVTYGPSYYKTLVGTLGWLTINLPLIAYVIPLTSLALLAMSDGGRYRFPRLFLQWSLLVTAACALLIATALYISWNPVGASVINGIQGRYFLPLLPVVALLSSYVSGFSSQAKADMVRKAGVALIAVEIFIMQGKLHQSYGVFQ